MTRLENNHFRLNRILLHIVGLWPYEQSKFSRFRFILFSGILMAFVVFQLTVLLTSRCTSDLILKVLSTALLFCIMLIKYISFGINLETAKELLTQFQHVYDELKDKNEIAIIDKYGSRAKRYTTVLLISTVACMCLLFVTLFWSDVLNVVLQMNMSQHIHLPIMTEYFIDQEKYFYLITLHMGTTVCIGIAVLLAIGTMLIAFYYYICGVFRVVSYRIEHSMKFNMIHNSTTNEIVISEKLICAVDLHRRAIKLSIFIVSRLEIMYSCLIISGVAALSLNLFRICQVASLKINLMEMTSLIFIITAIILYMFVANLIGQNITDHCRDVFVNAYNIQWYIASLRVQRFILFLLQKGSTDFKLNIGGLFIASLEGFAMLVKVSVSYFTVIYSTR